MENKLSSVDSVWTCGCGASNGGYRIECGNCGQSKNKPWGNYRILLDDNNCKVKQITVNPQKRLSSQYHQYRDELWMIVKGEAKIEINNKEIWKSYGETVSIKKEQQHRVTNPSFDNELIFIEIQTGSSFDEDDITRVEDDYNRN